MKYFRFLPNDQRKDNWIFFEYTDGPLYLRSLYQEFQCPECRKIDEGRALKKGIAETVRIRSKDDFLLTEDGLLCTSQKFAAVIRDENIKGFEFIDLPADDNYQIAVPQFFAETDVKKAGMEFEEPRCCQCGRYRSVIIPPYPGAMKLPADPMQIFAPNVWLEDRRARSTCIYAGEVIVKILKKHKIKGIFYRQY